MGVQAGGLDVVAGCHTMGTIVGVPLLGAIVGAMAGCDCSVRLVTNASGIYVRCYCWPPLLCPFGCYCSVPLWAAMAGCYCCCYYCMPLRKKNNQSIIPFYIAFFFALILNKRWLVLFGVYDLI